MKAYAIQYKMTDASDVQVISLLAHNKEEAYEKAVYEEIPEREGHFAYSAWVSSVTYNNGNYRMFNTFEGKPY